MLITYLQKIVWFIGLVLLQALVLNSVHIGGYATPLLYVYLLLRFESDASRNELMLWAFFLGLLVDVFSDTPGMNAAAAVLLAVTVCANIFASDQKDELLNRTGAVIMDPTVSVKSTPNESGTDLFVLHEGTKVFIDDNSMKEWKEIRLEDGNVGWVKTSAIEVI